MSRSLLPCIIVMALAPACARPASAQSETETLLEDLRAGMASSDGDVVEQTAVRVGRLAKTLDEPEVLLPLIEQAVFSGRGTFEYGVVGVGATALYRVSERASRPAPVLATMQKVLTRMTRLTQTRDELVSGGYKLARRFPLETLKRSAMFLNDRDSEVRDTGHSVLYTAAKQLPPEALIQALDGLLPQLQRGQGLVAEVADYALRRARRAPVSRLKELQASLDTLVKTLEDPKLVEIVRSHRSELSTRALERAGKTDRFADYRRIDGSLKWGELLRDKLSGKSKGKGEAERFSAPRKGAPGEVVKGFLPDVVATEVFKTVQQAALSRAQAALAEGAPGEKAALEARVRAAQALSVRYLETNDIVARRAGSVVEVSYGLLHEVYARSMQLMEQGAVSAGERGMYQARVLGLVFAHEVAHALGLRAERPADAEAVRTVWSSLLAPKGRAQAEVALQGTLDLFARPTGARAFDDLLYRLRNFFRYGTARGRLEAMRRAAKGEADPLARFRRADGTVDWKKAAAERGAHEAAGLAKFGLALFLKELALVAQTGDRGRIEEFFDHLLTTDFYEQYGLFVAGARLGEVAYGRYLQRYVKPRFVNGVLKTNLALAAGMALPMIVEGRFEGKAFAISFASLGISSALVSSGARALRWVSTLKRARSAGLLARFGPAAGRLARIGGWFYTVGELAVVLYLADRIEGKANAWLEQREARRKLAGSGLELLRTLRQPNLTEAQAREALGKNHEAWIGYRDFLFQPLLQEEARMALRLGKAAREAKLQSDERAALLKKAKAHPALRKNLERRYGSLEGYADAQAKQQVAALQKRMDALLAGYGARREKLFHAVYAAERRDEPYLADFDPALLDAGKGRSDVFGRWNRQRAASSLKDSLGDVSSNRLQAYEDELALLKAAGRLVPKDGPAARALAAQVAVVERLQRADARLARGQPLVEADRAGAAAKLPGGR